MGNAAESRVAQAVAQGQFPKSGGTAFFNKLLYRRFAVRSVRALVPGLRERDGSGAKVLDVTLKSRASGDGFAVIVLQPTRQSDGSTSRIFVRTDASQAGIPTNSIPILIPSEKYKAVKSTYLRKALSEMDANLLLVFIEKYMGRFILIFLS